MLLTPNFSLSFSLRAILLRPRGRNIERYSVQINKPPNQPTKTCQNNTVLLTPFTANNSVNPVVVNAETISKYNVEIVKFGNNLVKGSIKRIGKNGKLIITINNWLLMGDDFPRFRLAKAKNIEINNINKP